MKHIVIIGGGAAGLIAAIHAKRKNNRVTILEKNSVCGKKILATGNGKCNYWNEEQSIDHYHSSNQAILSKIITEDCKKEVLSFFNQLGIYPKIRNGYYYPASNQALTIRDALVAEAIRIGVVIKNNYSVTKIRKEQNLFKIYSLEEDITADKIIIATGSKASSKTGSDGFGYKLLKDLGHQVLKPQPALVQVKTSGKYLKSWSGVRADAKVSLYIDNKLIKEEQGEIQLTDYGISGICVFNISRYIPIALENKQNVQVKINFLPFITENAQKFLDNYFQDKPIRPLELELSGFLNQKLITTILTETSLKTNTSYQKLSKQAKKVLVNALTNFTVIVTATNSFEQAQVCSGGVPLTEIIPETMESTIIKDLYIAGELLDVDGDCGGYNLGFAWMSGIKAGKGCVKND